MNSQEIQKHLFELSDIEYKEFHSKLMPTIDPNTILGVRTPKMRNFVKELKNDDGVEEFLNSLPHKYYEENNLHGFLIEQIKDYDQCILRIEEFLPYINNWATCDSVKPKIFAKNKSELFKRIKIWIKSDETYTIRYAVNMLMGFYLDEDFAVEHLKMVSNIKSDEYYVKMVVAWYFATALAKHYEETLPFIENREMEKWTHNKTIQKAIESYRITPEQKEYLRTLKIK